MGTWCQAKLPKVLHVRLDAVGRNWESSDGRSGSRVKRRKSPEGASLID